MDLGLLLGQEVVIIKDAIRCALHILILIGLQRPQKRREPQSAKGKRHGYEKQKCIHATIFPVERPPVTMTSHRRIISKALPSLAGWGKAGNQNFVFKRIHSSVPRGGRACHSSAGRGA